MIILYAFTRSMELQDQMWKPGMSLLDVGGGTGALAAYLAGAYGIDASVYEIPFTTCKAFLTSPFRINFFWGTLPVAATSFDAVSFMNVFCAADNTVSLLRQAAPSLVGDPNN